MKYELYVLICEIQIREKEKANMKTGNSIAVPSFELPNKENLLHIFHNRKKEPSIPQEKNTVPKFQI